MKRRGVIACAALIACSLSARAQWTQTAGPQGADITAIAADDSHIIATIYNDVLNYDYGEKEWSTVGSLKELGGPGSSGGDRMALVNAVLLAGTGTGLARSTDFGKSWNRVDQQGTLYSDERYFYLMEGESLRRSSDGINWSDVGTLPQFAQIPVTLGDASFTSTVYFGELFRSTDNGVTWEKQDATFPLLGREGTAGMGLTVAIGGDYLYAVVGGAEVLRSSDGTNWTNITYDLPDWLGAREITARGSEVYINTNHGMFRFDGTSSWDKIDLSYARQIVLTSKGAILCGTGGVYSISNGSSAMASLNRGLIHAGAFSIGSIDTIVLANTTFGIFRTTDNGENWARVADFGVWGTLPFINHNGTLYASYGVTYRSTDSGATWAMTGPKYDFDWDGPEYFTEGSGFASDGSSLYLGISRFLTGKGTDGTWAAGGVWRSDDDGATWHEVSATLPHGAGNVPAPVGSIIARSNYVLMTTAAGIYRSTNQGDRWYMSMNGLPTTSQYIGNGELYDGGDMIYLRLGFNIFQSGDGGQNWMPMQNPLSSEYSWTTPFFIDDLMYMQTYKQVDSMTFEYHLLTYDGKTWDDVTSTQPHGVVFTSMIRAGNYLYTGTTTNGVWRMKAGSPQQSASVATHREAGTMHLASYPNPTTGLTEVEHTLPTRSSVRIAVVNTLGEEVIAMAEGTIEAGVHRYSLDLRTLPPGSYIVRLTTESQSSAMGIVKTN